MNTQSKWFGPKPWGPFLGPRVPSPEAPLTCIHCGEAFATDDCGLYINGFRGEIAGTEFDPRMLPDIELEPAELPLHGECWIRLAYGSIRHQRGECQGDGSCNDREPGLTRRQDAALASEYFLQRIEIMRQAKRTAPN